MKRCSGLALSLLALQAGAAVAPFAVDTSPPPATHAALGPEENAIAATNPPSLTWRHDATAQSYIVEFSTSVDFTRDCVRVEGLPMPFYNHDQSLATGRWYWRYFVVRAGGEVSQPGPVHAFRITAESVPLPVPSPAKLLATLPGHPRIFTTPDTLAEFRARRLGAGREAWDTIKAKADALLAVKLPVLTLDPLPATFPAHRQQVFYVQQSEGKVPRNYRMGELKRDALRANLLSLAWLISGDERYARAAREWALFLAPFRVDYHLKSIEQRGQHDTVVYSYEKGVTALAETYDRVAWLLTAEEKRVLLEHIEYHGDAAFQWIRNVMQIHLTYQDSHAQQCMHELLPTALAIAGDSAKADAWLAYLVPQYANRIAWMSDDGGYFEGQSYSFKFSYILEALVALRSATGIDLFKKPAIHNAGDFWLYCMSLNYWWPHGGDNMPLVNPYGNAGDAYISGMLASSTNHRELQWWSNTVPADPIQIPLGYLAATGVSPRPPVGIAQARAFPETGQVSAFARLYDHAAERILFRSSKWGGDSHAHADQNSFVLHAGGEILAADVGYYTFFGDQNYDHISTQTIAHNSVLLDGKGQLNDINGPGAITAFFNSPDFVFFAGDASKAYGPAVNRFRRDVLYLRPDLFVMADELRAPRPGAWSWTLNTFAAPEIDRGAQEFVVPQRGERLWGKQVFPETLTYTSSNERKYPFFTKQWTRFTEAFPEPWRLQAVTESRDTADFLTVLKTYEASRGRGLGVTRSLQSATTSAVELKGTDWTVTALLRRRQDESGGLQAWEFSSDGRAFAVKRGADGAVQSWVAVAAQRATLDGRELFRAKGSLEIAVMEHTAAAARQIWTQAKAPVEVTLPLARAPRRLLTFAPDRLAEGREVPVAWSDGALRFTAPEGGAVFWIDPVVEPGARPATLALTLADRNGGTQTVALETAVAENGDWIASATVDPQAPGVYEVSSSDAATEFLLQDHWDPERSTRGRGRVTGLIARGEEIVVRFPPSANVPKLTARLVETRAPGAINLIRNGDCEAGLPGYPPRGWTVRHGAYGEFASEGRQGWPGWSQEMAVSGRSSLKFTRPLNRMTEWQAPYNETAKDTLAVAAPPVRLLAGGKYRLTVQAKGTATHARVQLVDATGTIQTIELRPSQDWREYRLETALPPGYTEVRIHYRAGGADDQVLWVDDLVLVPVGQ
jgi:hypothetical protein